MFDEHQRRHGGADAATHPERVGPYHIVSVLGEGGMGTVCKAEQHEPVHRRVALELLKLGMDSRAIVAGSSPSVRC